MHPILFKAGPLTLHTYGLFVALGLATGLWLWLIRARRYGLSAESVWDAAFVIFLAGLAGARFLYVWQFWPAYRLQPAEALYIHHGGLVWYGGFLGAALAGIVYARLRDRPLLKFCDCFAPGIALAHAVGRIGCFFNGCCFGQRGMPVQLYEAGGLVVIAGALLILEGRLKRSGDLFFLYVALYAVLRFGLEFLRGDHVPIGMFTLSQWISLTVLAALPAAVLLRNRWNPSDLK